MEFPHFHLSIGVDSVQDSADFFEHVLKAEVTHRDPSGYINVNFYGCQITLQEGGSMREQGGRFHFGANLTLDAFKDLSNQVLRFASDSVVMAPEVKDAGTSLERWKMYMRCPSGYLIELKGYQAV